MHFLEDMYLLFMFLFKNLIMALFKRVIIALSFLCFSFSYLFGQDDIRNQYDILNFKWLSPEAFQMQESSFLNLDNSLFYGRMEYSIPLYEISIGNIKLPISLNYSSGGLKVEQEASDVGFSWFLNTGGIITRMIKGGVMDNDKRHYQENTGGGTDDFMRVGWNKLENSNGISDEFKTFDNSPDEFVFSALGFSDRFIYEDRVLPNINPTGKDYMSLTGSNISYLVETGYDIYDLFSNESTDCPFRDFNKISVNLPNGIKVEFVPIEATSTLSQSSMYNNDSYVAWGVHKITDVNSGRVIRYIYSDLWNESKKTVIIHSMPPESNPYVPSKEIIRYSRKLVSIIWDGGSVNFLYNKIRNDKLSLYNRPADKQLDEIKVYNNKQELVKSFALNYGYFVSAATNKTYKDYRLKLTSVNEVSLSNQHLPSYNFEYFNETAAFPAIDSKEQDYWGFFNANGETTLWPKLYFYKSLVPTSSAANKQINPFLPFIIKNENNQELLPRVVATTGVIRDPNEQACKTGMLKKITLPTGGFHEFDYELNQFYYDPGENVSPQLLLGGGLRLKSQKLNDGVKTRIFTYNYNYDNVCQGFISKYPQFIFSYYENFSQFSSLAKPNIIRNFPNSIYEPVIQNGSYVGYKVVEEIETGNGRKQLFFHGPPLMGSFTITPPPSFIRASDYHCSFPNLYPTVGLLQTVKVVDEDGKISKITSNVFTKKLNYEFTVNENVFYKRLGNLKYYLSEYKVQSWVVQKDKVSTEESLIKPNGVNTLYTDKMFFYNDNNLLSSTISYKSTNQTVDIGSGNRVSIEADMEEIYYNHDFNDVSELLPYPVGDYSDVLRKLEKTNQIVPILRKNTIINSETHKLIKNISDIYYHYRLMDEKVIADEILTKSYSSQGIATSVSYKFYSFDRFGRPTVYQKGNDGLFNIIRWLPNYDVPLFYGTSPKNDKAFYTSFEVNEEDQAYDQHALCCDAKIGDRYYTFSASEPLAFSPLGLSDYTISFWYKGTGNVYLNLGQKHIGNISSTDWTYFSVNSLQCNPSSLSFSGTISLDDVRILPIKSQFSSYVHRSLVGVLAQTDMNGITTNYDYDGFNRLKSVLDHSGKVLKFYDYNFGRNNGAITNITPPLNGVAIKNFNFSYSAGWYVTSLDDYGGIDRISPFQGGTIEGELRIKDIKTGVMLDVPFYAMVLETDTPSIIMGKILSNLPEDINRERVFNNIQFSGESNSIKAERINPALESDLSGLVITVKSLQEFPPFNVISTYTLPHITIQN